MATFPGMHNPIMNIIEIVKYTFFETRIPIVANVWTKNEIKNNHFLLYKSPNLGTKTPAITHPINKLDPKKPITSLD